ncbi:site-specific integrase [bacterium]|nr:site-specific integrase [bacterium]
MTFFNREGVLYVSINGIRKSTKLKYSKQNIKKFQSYYEDEEFFNNFNINKSVPTILELVSDVLNEKEKELKRNSYRSYLALYESRIEPYFKNILVTEFKPLDVHNWYKTFQDSSTLNTCNNLLKSAFEKAIIKGYILNSPFLIKKPKFKNNYKINPFSFDEANIIIDKAPDKLKNLLAVAFYTGMRTGEVLGLKWINIDFDSYTIKIDSQMTGGFEDTPKTYSSNRVIDMLPQCEYYLKEQFKISFHSKYVFLNSLDKPFSSSSSLQYTWKNLLNKLNIDFRSIYQTRHTFASNMLSNGENPLWISQMLGHKSLNVTLDKYSKFIKNDVSRKSTYLDN